MLKLSRQFYNLRSIYKVTSVVSHQNKRLLSSNTQLLQNPKESLYNLENPRKSAEHDYLVRVQDNPDVFGECPAQTEPLSADDQREEDHLTNTEYRGKRLSTKQYADIIKSLIQKKKIKEAIDIVEVRMLKVDKVQPENYLYNLLLGACGKVGYTKKAFQLFNDIKRRGLKVHPGAYTALFNACANSPWPEDGLNRAKHLHNSMIENSYQPNDSNYHAMIKAYGRCGDINTAFALADEMFRRKFPIKDDTLNFLLQACISDKEAGFSHALLVWHKFQRKRIKPSLFSYNLLLRVTRNCGLGGMDVTKDVLKKILPENDRFLQIADGQPPNKDSEDVNSLNIQKQEEEILGGRLTFEDNTNELNRPNLLAHPPKLGDIVLIEEVTRAEDRLLLLGGAQNFLQEVINNECKPDIKTFTQLLDALPASITAETELLQNMKKFGVSPDLDFYNMLIKKRSMRFDYSGAKYVLSVLQQSGMQPDLITYGILALGCRNKEEAANFLYEMEAAKYRLNTEILGAMLQQSTFHMDFPYVLFVMEQCVSCNIQPNKMFMERLTKFHNRCKKLSNNDSLNYQRSKKFMKGFQTFRMRLKTWTEQVTPEEDVHPWQQFRQPVETDVRHYKEDRSSNFKPRHLTKFRVKTTPVSLIEKHRFKQRKFRNSKSKSTLQIQD